MSSRRLSITLIAGLSAVTLAFALTPAFGADGRTQQAGAGRRAPQQQLQQRQHRQQHRPELKLRIFRLEHAQAIEATAVLDEVLGPGASVVADRRTNSLLITAPTGAFDEIEVALAALDQPAPVEGELLQHQAAVETRVIPLEQATAGDILGVLQVLESSRRVRVAASGEANAIVLLGATDEIDRLTDIVAKLDVPPVSPAADRELRMTRIRHLPAQSAAQTLHQVARAMGFSAEIIPNNDAGVVIAYAAPQHHETLARVLEELDVPRDDGER